MPDTNSPKVSFAGFDCKFAVKGEYPNGRMAYALTAWEDNPEQDIFEGMPIATVSINIPEVELAEGEVIVKDYSENTGMVQALISAGIVEPTGKVVDSGFVTCPICKLI
jgi:hypothetical protein